MKPRETSTKEGAGSGCMARLVRFLDSLRRRLPTRKPRWMPWTMWRGCLIIHCVVSGVDAGRTIMDGWNRYRLFYCMRRSQKNHNPYTR
jgi:hypothetical protein